MSAFTPYKRLLPQLSANPRPDLSIVNLTTGVSPNHLVRLPIDFTSVILKLPDYHKSLLDLNYFHQEKPPADDGKKKNEKFLMKNILARDPVDKEKEKIEEIGEKIELEEHASRMETLMSNLGKSDAGHRCIYCGKVYSRKYGLKIHIRTHTGYKPLKCKFCLRPFGDPSNLNKHVRLHAQGQTPYKCQYCNKILVRRRDLERHVKSRHSISAPPT